MPLLNPESKIKNGNWLPDMDLNHDKQIQSLLCYRYTIGQGNVVKLEHFRIESRNCRLRIADCGFSGMQPPQPGNPQSAIRNPQPAIEACRNNTGSF